MPSNSSDTSFEGDFAHGPIHAAKVELTEHFAIPIYRFLIPDFASHQERLAHFILARYAETKGVAVSNQRSWHSEQSLHLIDDPEIQWLKRTILAFARACLGNRYGGLGDRELAIVSCWANACGAGGWHTPHNHFPCQWSGILYVSAASSVLNETPNDKSGKLEFFNPNVVASAIDEPSGVCYAPEDGAMLFFPGVLQHMVHPNLTENLRTSIAFNVNRVRRPEPISRLP